jgi:hypothetical protein
MSSFHVAGILTNPVNPEAGECHISSEMWQRDFKKYLLWKVFRLEIGEERSSSTERKAFFGPGAHYDDMSQVAGNTTSSQLGKPSSAESD